MRIESRPIHCGVVKHLDALHNTRKGPKLPTSHLRLPQDASLVLSSLYIIQHVYEHVPSIRHVQTSSLFSLKYEL